MPRAVDGRSAAAALL